MRRILFAAALLTLACAADDIETDDLIRWDHGSQTFVIIRSENDTFHAMDGICSHEKVHLCDGLVMDGTVECPKHNGRFDIRDGRAEVELTMHPDSPIGTTALADYAQMMQWRRSLGVGGALGGAGLAKPRPRGPVGPRAKAERGPVE